MLSAVVEGGRRLAEVGEGCGGAETVGGCHQMLSEVRPEVVGGCRRW